MSAVITDPFRVYNALTFQGTFATNKYYLGIGRITPWTATTAQPLASDNNPPIPGQAVNDEYDYWRTTYGAKLIQPSLVSLVIPNYTWASGTVFTQYDSSDSSLATKNFYAMNSTFDVYKCIDNNNGAASTVQPTGTSTAIFSTGDGYRWKYMFTINTSDITNFITPQYIPVKLATLGDGSGQAAVQAAAVPGQIVSYRVVSGGTGYTTAPTLTVVGDGTGATATAVVSGGAITRVTVTGLGQNYTFATVTIGGPGTGASIAPNLAPQGGHGSDARYELGAYYVSIVTYLNYNESGKISVANDYRTVAIIQNPFSFGTSTVYSATAARQTYRLTVANASSFQVDEVVVGATSTARANIVEVDTTNNYLFVTVPFRNFSIGENIQGQTSGAISALSAIQNPDIQPFTGGKIIFAETRKPQPRDGSQIEKLVSVIEW